MFITAGHKTEYDHRREARISQEESDKGIKWYNIVDW